MSQIEQSPSIIITRKNEEFGIPGYFMPDPNKAHFYKARTFRIPNPAKNEISYLTMAVKEKQGVPSPTLYQPQ